MFVLFAQLSNGEMLRDLQNIHINHNQLNAPLLPYIIYIYIYIYIYRQMILHYIVAHAISCCYC